MTGLLLAVAGVVLVVFVVIAVRKPAIGYEPLPTRQGSDSSDSRESGAEPGIMAGYGSIPPASDADHLRTRKDL